MNKKILDVFIIMLMIATVLSGCVTIEVTPALSEVGETHEGEDVTQVVTEKTVDENSVEIEDDIDSTGNSVEEPSYNPFEEKIIDEGSVLNIYCWNDEFKNCMANHYPGYVEVDDTHGTIGDVQVVWNISSTEGNAYQSNLDASLIGQVDAYADDKVDIFLIDADSALKYVNTDYTMSLADLGIKLEDTVDQYQYTKDVVTDYNGILKGVSWQACPGVMICRRDIAMEIFGTEEPNELNKYFADWDKFKESSGKLKEVGYKVTNSVDDTFRVYACNLTSKWVEEEKINIDSNIKNWVNDSKLLYDSGMVGDAEFWSEEWKNGMYSSGDVFSYFGPEWFADSKMYADEEGSIANNGGYVAIAGPQPFFWGGTWICAATGTDNPALAADIMKTFTCDKNIMSEIAKSDKYFVNNKSVMEELATDVSYEYKVFGGQNALTLFCQNADKIDFTNITADDKVCNEEFQKAMREYYNDNSTYDEALESFYKAVVDKCPWLIY